MRSYLLFLLVLLNCFPLLSSQNENNLFIKYVNSSNYKSAYSILKGTPEKLDYDLRKNISFDAFISFVKWMQKIDMAGLRDVSKVRYHDIIQPYILGKNSKNDFAAIELLHKEIIRIAKEYQGENSSIYRTSLETLADFYDQFDMYQMADSVYQKVLHLYQRQKDVSCERYTSLLHTMATFYLNHGEYARSNMYEEEAKRISGNSNNNSGRIPSLSTVVSMSIGDANEAKINLIQQVEECGRVLGQRKNDWADLAREESLYYVQIGDTAEAHKCILKANQIEEKTYIDNYLKYSEALRALGDFYLQAKDIDSAIGAYSEAYDISKQYAGEINGLLALSIGKLYIALNQFDDAIGSLEDAKMKIEAGGYYWKETLRELAKAYQFGGYPREAELYYLLMGDPLLLARFYDSENRITDATKCYNDYLSLKKETDISDVLRPQYSYACQIVGEYYYRQGWLNEASDLFEEAIILKRGEYIYSLNYLLEHQRESFWDMNSMVLRQCYPICCLRLNNAEGAYNFSLFSKGLLLSSAQLFLKSITESEDSSLQSDFQKFLNQKSLITYYENRKEYYDTLPEMRQSAIFLERRILSRSAVFRRNCVQWNITWDSVRNHLNKEQVAIEYMVAPLNEDSTMYCALLLRKNRKYPELIPLFEEKEALALINTSNESYTNNTYLCEISKGDTLGNSLKLSNLVWGKILPHIKPGETIYFAPSGLLHQLAIENLPYDASHTMFDKYNMVRLSSTREIVLCKEAPKHTSATLYGGIQYDMSGNELLAESKQYSQSDLLASRGLENDSLDRGNIKDLPGSKTEVENINRLLRENHLSAQLFTSTTANEESFKALSGQHRNIIHIATHGFYWSDSTAQKKDYFSQRMIHRGDDRPAPHISDPLDRCGLLFAGAQTAWSGHSADLPPGVQDGILTAKEISLLDLRDADLVVLSACETGKGEITGEGVFGLQRAFKQAGAQTIIMSLWKVNDEATQLLMTEFYRNWLSGQSKREAFRNAQNTVRSQYPEPIYWAGFIMLD